MLYDYTAPRKASQAVQKYLSTPIVGSEMNILRCPTSRVVVLGCSSCSDTWCVDAVFWRHHVSMAFSLCRHMTFNR